MHWHPESMRLTDLRRAVEPPAFVLLFACLVVSPNLEPLNRVRRGRISLRLKPGTLNLFNREPGTWNSEPFFSRVS